VIAFSVILGMLGYHFICNLTWIDSFFNASMIAGGMGPVAELTTGPAKMFAGMYALFSGIVFLGSMTILIAPILHRFLHVFHFEDKN